jgi:carbamoylphosphate synthase large subunit/very-short-patch-repair endonuclease
MPRSPDIRSVLIIGSGPIVIGQAAEFDYAGTQACKALREEDVRSILVNSNPATIMTDEGIADATYIEPLTVEVIARIIERERPDGILGTLGGQTGLNLAVALDRAGVLERFGTRSLGTPVASIQRAEDREAFKQLLLQIGEPVPPSRTVSSLDGAVAFADEIGLPLVIRPAYTLGGTGGGVAWSHEDLIRVTQGGLDASPIHQVLVEQYLRGWKELEYEVIRDAGDTCITVCNMENLDPLGIHTGDSIVVAPSQTLTDREYQMLRGAAIKIIRALGVEGGCNVQFALDPHSEHYYVIEVNPRVSRSSALASKATGYPIARVATKIALGYRLHEIQNAVTGRTSAAFEPALDYVVVKIPRWPFDKFPGADRSLGTQMKATGEVMAIDRTFEAALLKAMRSLEVKTASQQAPLAHEATAADPFASSGIRRAAAVAEQSGEHELVHDPAVIEATDARLWRLMDTLREDDRDDALAALHNETGIDRWFLTKLRRIVRMEAALRAWEGDLPRDLLWRAKRIGLSDAQIAQATGATEAAIRQRRAELGVRPVYKMVDTCAGEFAAQTPYYYSTYEVENEAPSLAPPKAVVIGSGPIRIGQGIEFDYCSVRSATALRAAGVASIMINSNPETVSTDFDMSDRLYFEPLDVESVLAVLENEAPEPHHLNLAPPPTPSFRPHPLIPSPSAMERGNEPEPDAPRMGQGLKDDQRRALCRELRQRQMPAEQFLWELVRDHRLDGFGFRRQHPLGSYVADFYCPALKLVIELDGGIHQRERDRARDEAMAHFSLHVMRINNDDLLADPEGTLDAIARHAAQIEQEQVSTPSPSKMGRGPGGGANTSSAVSSLIEPGGALPPAIVQFGGQTAINLAGKLSDQGVPLLGTPADLIDLAEDRERFDELMERLDIPRPRGMAVRTVAQALRAADAIGYPVLVRPSYVLGGRAMEIVRSPDALRRYTERALSEYGEHPLLVDRYLAGIEVEVDAICDGDDVLIPGIMRHIERAGVHSGDSFAVYPALGLDDEAVRTIVDYTTRMSLAMGVRGLMNIQFVVVDPPAGRPDAPRVFVIEANPRASRTVPFLSKVTGVPMVTLATRIMLGESLHEQGYRDGLWPRQPLVAVKAPVFSMSKIRGAEAALGPEMKSTGEVMGIDRSYEPALMKAFLAAGISLPKAGAAFVSIADRDKAESLPTMRRLAAHGYHFYATPGTAQWLTDLGMRAEAVSRIGDGESRIPELIRTRQVALVINTITGGRGKIREGVEIQDGFLIRRNAVESGVPCFTSLDTARALVELLDASPDYSVLTVGEYRLGAVTSERPA